jgi:Tol biopolymer transport system component
MFMLAQRISIPAALAFSLVCLSASAQVTQRLSVSSTGMQGNLESNRAYISADNRYVSFYSYATTLVPGDTNAASDVFIRDLWTGTLQCVSRDAGGALGNAHTFGGSMSADNRYIALYTYASNLVPGDTNGVEDVIVRDRQTGTNELVSVGIGGAQADAESFAPMLSGDGRFVAFCSLATNLVPGDTNLTHDIFVRDRQLGTTERVSVDSNGNESDGYSYSPYLSPDGRFVAFLSRATNLVAGDTNGKDDIFVRDRQLGTTERVSVDSSGNECNGHCLNAPTMSLDGRYVAFDSVATNLVIGQMIVEQNVFVHDRTTGITERVSSRPDGGDANGHCGGASISGDGRFVAFFSFATNLVPGDANLQEDDFIRDRLLGVTDLVSVSSGGAQGNSGSYGPHISDDGRYVAFGSLATNLVTGDTNLANDVFLRDRMASGFTSSCEPGVGSVMACPCSNPPASAGRGCDNSSSTGGAVLQAAGIAYLSMDNLVFTTAGEKPSATSIVLQGNAAMASGLAFGQGVRCVGGLLKRLYTKSASAGSITAPNFGLGDPSVSARSAVLGDVISAGESRWYLVYYRDPVVLGGCTNADTFNSTQTGRVDWSL